MGVLLEYYKDLVWISSWNGYEIGHNDVDSVQLFVLKDTNLYLYIDQENNRILDYWESERDED